MERTFTELIKTAHEHAKAGGWWDTERNAGELLMLIVSECGEALEAHRKGKFAVLTALDLTHPGVAEQNEAFKLYVKDTFEDELADIVIRLADLCGGFDVENIRWSDERRFEIREYANTTNVGEALLGLTEDIIVIGHNLKSTRSLRSEDLLRNVDRVLQGCWNLAGKSDLWKHIELKMAYNKTRGYKHGKAY